MAECVGCGGRVEESFRFCPWCATPQRVKLVEFFRGHALNEQERGKALRVSRYLGPKRHVRFSVWSEAGVAEAAVSLDEREAGRLRRFLGPAEPAPARREWPPRPRVFRRAAARREA
jgi:hypothetical protein